MSASLYERDFYAWASQQATLLRAGKLGEADIANIAEEIDSMGKSEKRELISRLKILLLHLLKWRHQPALRCVSWQLSVKEHRRELLRHLKDNPSLKSKLPEAIEDAFGDALIGAQRETGLPEDAFPAVCPFTFAEMVDDGFWPV